MEHPTGGNVMLQVELRHNVLIHENFENLYLNRGIGSSHNRLRVQAFRNVIRGRTPAGNVRIVGGFDFLTPGGRDNQNG